MVAAAPLGSAPKRPPLGAARTGRAPAAAPAPAPAARCEQASYLFGLTFGEQLHSVGVTDQVSLGCHHARHEGRLQGKKSTPADRQQIQQYVHSPDAGRSRRATRPAAKEFLASNGKKKGVKTTASGCNTRSIEAGDAKAPRDHRRPTK